MTRGYGKIIPPVIQTSVKFSSFNLHFLSWYYAWNAETLQDYKSKGVLSSALYMFLMLAYFDLFEFSATILEKGLFELNQGLQKV